MVWFTDDEAVRRQADERPFDPCSRLATAEQVDASLRLPDAGPRVRAMRFALVASAAYAVSHDATWVHYPRDRNRYVMGRRYLPDACSLLTVTVAVDHLQQAGLIFHDKVSPGSHNDWRSRFRPTLYLREAIADAGPARVLHAPRDTLVMRDKDKRDTEYRETEFTRKLRADINAQNAVLRDLDLDIDHPDVVRDPDGMLIIRGQRYDLDRRIMSRIFNGSWQKGGRWFGPAFQSLPKAFREALLINGAATVERDYHCLHPTLIRAAAGLDPRIGDLSFDAYRIDGIERWLAKIVVNIMLNADTAHKARGAIAKELRERGVLDYVGAASHAYDAVYRACPDMAPLWSTGVGLLLQSVDAEMAAGVMRDMRSMGVPCLCVHDSFIVPKAALELLAESMSAHLITGCKLAEKALRPILMYS